MTELLLEESKSTVRVKLWEFELEDFDEDVIPLLRLVWEVNNNMKRRDVEFEARRLLNSPETIPPQFQHPKIISQAHKYAKSLTEQHQQIRSSKLLCPREVVMEVVPKVVQGFWLPPPNTSFNMPSKQLSKMAVGVTKAVEDRVSTTLPSMLLQVSFSRFIRNDVVLSIQEKVRQGYTKDVLVKMLNCFSAKVLKTISDVAAAEICVLFQPQTHTKVPPNLKPREDCTQPADVVDLAEAKTSSAVMTPPPAPPTLATTPANTGLDEAEEQSMPNSEPDFAVVPAPPLPLTPAAQPSVTASVLQSSVPSSEPDSAVATTPVITTVQDDQTASAEPPDNFIVHNGFNNSLDNTEEEPTSSPQPDSSALSPPPAPLTLITTPANTGLDEAEEQPVPSSEPDSAVATTPVITTVQDDQIASAEPPDNFVVPNGLNKSLEEAEEEPTSSLKPDSSALSPPPAPLTLITTPANTGLDEAEEQSMPSSEPDSAVATTPAVPVSPADESPVISAVQDDLTASAESPSNSSIHNGLNNSLDEAEEEPTSSPQPDSSALSPPPAPLTLATTPANTGLDEAEEQPMLSPESAVIPPPPAPLTPSPEPPVNAANNPNTQGPTFSPEPDSTFVIAPPPPVTPPADESPAISAVQDDLIFMQQPVRVDESFTTTTEVKKTKRRRFSRFFGWLRKNICCCFLSEDTEAE
ncbi:cell surface glycoprotein 1 [Lates calcarifer]|uniref:Cell surface glycoprotein 1 n=1 Tax=Lates calcarifer TaxID=8187 RepID=A0AAJ7V6U8_LATCA|nr:cell surface glycoprotein 1 [Lates calcarifer]